MKHISIFMAMVTTFTLIMTAGCFTVVTPVNEQAVIQTSGPLTGKWEVTRLSISPQVPVPDFVLNQVIAQKATWKISRVTGKLAIDYGGRDTWYNPMGIDIQKKPIQVNESNDKRSCIFKSGGIIQIPGLPALLGSEISANIQNITVDFDDTVTINLSSDSALSVTTNVQANGKYSSNGQIKTFSQAETITYRGVKK
jgi:hypothetical protein